MELADVNRQEIKRYLGMMHGTEDTEEASVSSVIESCLEELYEKVRPSHVFRTFPLMLKEEGEIDLTAFTIHSKNLSKNLSGCTEVILFAATLGMEADLLIKRYEKIQMSRSVIMQAAGAAMIEAYCDEINEGFRKAYLDNGARLHPRFSPGYGDLSLEVQKLFLSVLEMDKRLGIRLTEGLLMVPTKSVTAVIGVEYEN